MKRNFFNTKAFAVIAILFGVIGLLIMCHHIFSYESILRPFMDYLIENKIITNDISGIAFLRMFTNQSNIFVDVYLILYALGIMGSKKLCKITYNEVLRSCITLNIAVTGIIYFTVLLPFGGGTFPKVIDGISTGGMWFSTVVNTWNHLVTPVLFTFFWFFPIAEKKLPIVKTSLYGLIYPILYFIISIFLGAKDGFYPYPFLSGKQLFEMLFKGLEYNSLIGVFLLAAAVVILSGVFFGVSCGLNALRNKRVVKSDKIAVNVK